MKKYVWQVLTLGLVIGVGCTLPAAAQDPSVPATDSHYTMDQSTSTPGSVKHNRRHRRAEGTNRSSRPGTTTGVHAIEGNDTPGIMGTPSPAASTSTYK